MSALLTTLPGDIPGLLRSGSILRHNGRRAVALQVAEGFVLVAHHATGADEETEVEGGTVPWDLVALDLSNSTSRHHAGRWANARREQISFIEQYLVDSALQGADMALGRIDTLARLVLRLAGRAP